MALEPTEEQLHRMADAIEWAVAEAGPDGNFVIDYATVARLAWPVARDIVLEEAAKAFERGLVEQWGPDAAAAVRSMKGAP